MTSMQIKGRYAHKHDTEGNWLKVPNFIPKNGEIIVFDADATHPRARLKVGNGVTKISALPFIADAQTVDDKIAELEDKIAVLYQALNLT